MLNAGSQVGWTTAAWDAVVPTGTSLGVSVRMGNTPTPDGTWTNWIPLSGSGVVIGGYSQYLQYEANLATTVPTQTPVLDDITFTYAMTNTVAPTILGESPAQGTAQVVSSAPITVSFSDLMNPASITNSTFYLTAVGSTTPIAATVSYAGCDRNAAAFRPPLQEARPTR